MPVVKQHGTEEPRETPNIAFASPTNFIKPKVILSYNFEVLLHVRKNSQYPFRYNQVEAEGNNGAVWILRAATTGDNQKTLRRTLECFLMTLEYAAQKMTVLKPHYSLVTQHPASLAKGLPKSWPHLTLFCPHLQNPSLISSNLLWSWLNKTNSVSSKFHSLCCWAQRGLGQPLLAINYQVSLWSLD